MKAADPVQAPGGAVSAHGRVHRPHEQSQHPAAQVLVALEEVTHAPRNRQHPLADRDAGNDVIDEMSGGLHHAPGVAGRAQPSRLAGKWNQEIVAAGRAVRTGEAEGRYAALEVLAEGALDIFGYGIVIQICLSGPGQEGLQVFLDQPVETMQPRLANELRFEDLKGSEQVFLQAEKDLTIFVKNDEDRLVGNDRTKHVKRNETTNVDGNRTETVGKDEGITIHGSRRETVDGDEKITISGSRKEMVSGDESISIGGSRSENVGKNESINIGGSRSETVAKDETIAITGARKVDIGKSEAVTVAKGRKQSVTGDDQLQVTKKLLVDGGEEIMLKSGSASITLKKDGTILIKGKDVTVQGSGKINVKASSDLVLKGSKISGN